jgi:hypothetical protein
MIILFLLFLFLDLQHPKIMDLPNQKFLINTVTEIDDMALDGCAINPIGGSFGNENLTVYCVDPFQDQTESLPVSILSLEPQQVVVPNQMMMNNPDVPLPMPEPSKPITTPEPSVAILTISGLALLYLIFGHKRQRLHRRSR